MSPEAIALRDKVLEFFDTHAWTKHWNAYDAAGNVISVFDEGAVSFCLIGAINRCVFPDQDACDMARKNQVGLEVRLELCQAIRDYTHTLAVAEFNDSQSSIDDIRDVLRSLQ